MDKAAVIVAGGMGTRMGSDTPKQFLEVSGRPILSYTLDAFYTAFPDVQIILVFPRLYLEEGTAMVHRLYPGNNILFTAGGLTRFDSVKNGLSLVKSPSVIFVHDAVRCLVAPALIRNCYEEALKHGSAIPVVPVKDSFRRLHQDGSEVVDRSSLRAVQTPQTFRSEVLLPAFQVGYDPSFTDEATVVEHHGGKVHLVQGDEGNIKITVPADLDFAEQVMGKQLNPGK
jgi:2-C-methyl-D-erythritol 4-phosphate cytidylyltransferase